MFENCIFHLKPHKTRNGLPNNLKLDKIVDWNVLDVKTGIDII